MSLTHSENINDKYAEDVEGRFHLRFVFSSAPAEILRATVSGGSRGGAPGASASSLPFLWFDGL